VIAQLKCNSGRTPNVGFWTRGLIYDRQLWQLSADEVAHGRADEQEYTMVDETAAASGEHPPGRDGCSLTSTWVGRVVVVTAKGTIDVLTAPRLTEAVDAALVEAPSGLIVDLSEVEFLASAGMSVLIEAHEKTSGSAGFGVVAAGPVTSRPMRLVGIHEIVAMYETLDSAIRGLNDA
jgi:anti-sigma B factor antagonist